MPESSCTICEQLKKREARSHELWTAFLYRNETKRLSGKEKRKHQRDEMEAYQKAHKARLAHEKVCSVCLGAPSAATAISE